jgi:hypothetical protein
MRYKCNAQRSNRAILANAAAPGIGHFIRDLIPFINGRTGV